MRTQLRLEYIDWLIYNMKMHGHHQSVVLHSFWWIPFVFTQWASSFYCSIKQNGFTHRWYPIIWISVTEGFTRPLVSSTIITFRSFTDWITLLRDIEYYYSMLSDGWRCCLTWDWSVIAILEYQIFPKNNLKPQ